MLLHDDYREKTVHEHHIIMGTAGRAKSEELGLKCNLCLDHHELGKEAVHRNWEVRRRLECVAQERFEELYSHEEWMEQIGRNYL